MKYPLNLSELCKLIQLEEQWEIDVANCRHIGNTDR